MQMNQCRVTLHLSPGTETFVLLTLGIIAQEFINNHRSDTSMGAYRFNPTLNVDLGALFQPTTSQSHSPSAC
jgi:hypothetical protein